MGNFFRSNPGNNTASKKTADFDNRLYKNAKESGRVIKLLLLGAGESGKSTLFKQAQIIHGDGFDENSRAQYVDPIHLNITKGMSVLIEYSEELTSEGVEDVAYAPELKTMAEAVRSLQTNRQIVAELDITLRDQIRALWSDPGLRNCFENHRAKCQIPDSASYFFDSVERVSEPDYLPTVEDVLRCRARTTGVVVTNFSIENDRFQIIDVGGQRSERKKWVRCFDDVTAVLFVAAINEYDMNLYEDDSVNRITEALEVFGTTCNSGWFHDPSIILFLNKKDLFASKIQHVDLNVLWPEYTGGCDYDNAVAFIEQKFRSMNQSDAQIYCHVTCATDESNIRFTLNSVKHIVIEASLKCAGL